MKKPLLLFLCLIVVAPSFASSASKSNLPESSLLTHDESADVIMENGQLTTRVPAVAETNELASAIPLACTPVLRIEAEDFSWLSGSMTLVTDISAGGDNTVVEVPNGAPLTSLDYVKYYFVAPSTATYYLRGRVRSLTGADDSFCVDVTKPNNTSITAAFVASNNALYPINNQCSSNRIYWDLWAQNPWQIFSLMHGWNGNQYLVPLSLTAGIVYGITIGRREDGTVLDWLELCM